MASRPERERQRVYLTYRDTFCGSKARVRDRKVIRSIVLKHWAQSGTSLDEQHLGTTITVLKALLKNRVFEFERQAREAFPDLFAKPPPFPHAIARSSNHNAKFKHSTNTDRKGCGDNIISPVLDVSYGKSLLIWML